MRLVLICETWPAILKPIDLGFNPASTTHAQTSNDFNQFDASKGASESNSEALDRCGSQIDEGVSDVLEDEFFLDE